LSTGAGADRFVGRNGAPLCFGRKRGELSQAIGGSRGGRTTRIHALTDAFCRPIAFLLTGGQVADCTAADRLLDQMPQTEILHGDKGYDSGTEHPAQSQPPLEDASRPIFTATVTPSNACLGGSRISAESPPDMTALHAISSPPSVSRLRSATGYESGA
jgi:hypothetical protein